MVSKGRQFVFDHKSHHRPEYESLEGNREWAGRWELHRDGMTWWRPQYYYFRTASTGLVEKCCQLGRGPMVRPGPLRDVVHLDVPHAVLRSHPEKPNALPEELEGVWIDTNPAWPEMSVEAYLVQRGLKPTWPELSAEVVEDYELIPRIVDGIDPDEAEPFDPTPMSLSATRIFVLAAENA